MAQSLVVVQRWRRQLCAFYHQLYLPLIISRKFSAKLFTRALIGKNSNVSVGEPKLQLGAFPPSEVDNTYPQTARRARFDH